MNQSLTHVLMTRTAAAEKRLLALSEQQERGGKPDSRVAKSALRELSEALKELRVATEHLELAADDLAIARRDASASADNFREFFDVLPVSCVITNDHGVVDEVNAHASKLLNVATAYLTGKPLLLYLPQRDLYFQLFEQVKVEGSAQARVMVRPRDRKAIEVGVAVTALKQPQRWCWVFSDSVRARESGVQCADSTPLPSEPLAGQESIRS
jgi:hypothetical protein